MKTSSTSLAFRFFTSALLMALFGSALSYAQVSYDTATLKGIIYDPNGGVVPGATVTVTNPATGVTRTVKSGGEGTYQVPALPPGTYEVTVEAAGFSKAIAKN